MPDPGELPADVVSSWVDVVGPWTGSVVLTTGRETAAGLTRALLGDHGRPTSSRTRTSPTRSARSPTSSAATSRRPCPGRPRSACPTSAPPRAVRNPADLCRVDVLWRGEPLSISVQGALPPLPEH